MATAGMTASYRSGEQRRGPPPRTARGNNYNQSRSQPGGMPKRNGAPNYSPISSLPNSPNVGSDDSGDDGFYTNSRMLSGVTQCVGKLVKVDVVNGGTYEGILMTISKDFSLLLDQAKLTSRPEGGCDSQVTNAFLIKKEDYISFRAVSVDVRADTFVDGAISGAGRVNGQNADPTKVKTLVQWNDDSDETGICLEDTSGSNGWDATEMFSTNAAKFNVETSYRDSMECYTTPLPKFKSAEEEQRARRFAEENARMIESSDGYKIRTDAENNPSVDEETKYSSVVRDPEPKQSQSTSDRYVIPSLRRGPGGGPLPPTAPSQQPLPPRERRERGDVRQSEGRVEQQPGRRWESNPGPRGPNQHPMPAQPPHIAPPQHSAPPPQHREAQDRINGDSRDRRQDMSGRSGSYNTNRPPPHHMGPPQQGAPSQRGPPQPLPHMPQHHPAQGPPAQVMPQMPPPPGVHRHPPPPVAAPPTNMPPPPNAGSPHSADKAPPVMSSQQAPTPQEAAVLVADKKSPREKDRHAKQVANLQQFHSNFNIKLEEEKKDERGSDQAGERRGEHHYDSEQQAPSQDLQGPASSSSSSHPPAVPSQPMGAHGVGTATSQGATASLPLQGPPATQAPAPSQSPSSGAKSSMLNPNAMEFKPRGVQVATTPTPSATPPAATLRQSPGMMQAHPHQHQHQHQHHSQPTPVLMPPSYSYLVPGVTGKMMPLQQTSSHQQQQSKPYAPKRAVVSVDPQVALAAQNATGQPLTLAAQAATLNQPSYVYQLPPGQMLQQGNPQGYPMQMRVVQSHMPQGAGMDPNQGAPNQQQHIQQQLFMAQQPVPAHMQAGGMTQTMAQPAHTHALHHHSQHLPHTHPHSQLPPASQPQVAHNHPHPHPSPSPVQSHPHGGPQGVQPPQSGTPQPMGYQHAGMAAMMPPQGHGAQHSAMPAHSQAQPAHNPTLHFMQQQHQMQFSQAGGGSSSGGPAPAHMQAGGHLNQPQHVVVMPQPPPQAINQAGPLNPLNPPHGPHTHHQHQHQHQHQHAAAAAQFQQQLQQQGQASQMHAAGVGPNQHMLQGGNVSAANAGLAMPHNLFMQPGLQAGHGHQHHAHHHPHPHPHTHTQHFQGQ